MFSFIAVVNSQLQEVTILTQLPTTAQLLDQQLLQLSPQPLAPPWLLMSSCLIMLPLDTITTHSIDQ